ncbi:hypothetical protein BD310DRAFT_926465 [Dichomitus squalens]|uniref:Uncharacterized protein n=1 Tax=Dichomitus squalens TaxID=114155 RepID=A0A4Q9PW72_9APHY|nr:hypothetical protein BD310DRAFT_926465 [Dichomitus squalens]
MIACWPALYALTIIGGDETCTLFGSEKHMCCLPRIPGCRSREPRSLDTSRSSHELTECPKRTEAFGSHARRAGRSVCTGISNRMATDVLSSAAYSHAHRLLLPGQRMYYANKSALVCVRIERATHPGTRINHPSSHQTCVRRWAA